MDICIIGGTGRLGAALVPLLASESHRIMVIARGHTVRPEQNPWDQVIFQTATYRRRDRGWYRFLEGLEAEVVIDLLGIDLPGTYRALGGRVRHLVAAAPFRMYGEPRIVPTPEEMQSLPEFPDMSRRYRETIGVQHQARKDAVAFTAVVLPTVTGPGYLPPDMQGGVDIAAHKALFNGEPVRLPLGANGLVAPCDVEDVGRAFQQAVQHRDRAADELFNIGPPYAITVDTLLGLYATAFQREFPIEYVPWEEFSEQVVTRPEARYFFRTHEVPDIRKIRERLEFEPHFTPEESVERSLRWMLDRHLL